MLSILNETKTKVFQQEQLTVRIFPSIQEMGSVAAKEVGDQICRLLESKPEINMIFAAAPSQNEFLSHLIHDKRIDWTRINAFHMDEYIGIHPEAPQSFGHFLRIRIFDKVPFKKVNYLNGLAENLEERSDSAIPRFSDSCLRVIQLAMPAPPCYFFDWSVHTFLIIMNVHILMYTLYIRSRALSSYLRGKR